MRTGSYSNCTAKKQGTLNSTKVIQVHYANSCGEKQRAKQGEHDGMAEVQADATHIHTYRCYSPVILNLPTYLTYLAGPRCNVALDQLHRTFFLFLFYSLSCITAHSISEG